jgi:AraC-like DNA-binding protein
MPPSPTHAVPSARPVDVEFSTQTVDARRFSFGLAPTGATDFWVAACGWEKCADGYTVERADFPFLCVEYVAAGHGRVTLGGRVHVLEPGVVFAYGPGLAHRLESDRRAPLSKYFVDFAGTRAQRLLQERRLRPGELRLMATRSGVQRAFDELLRAASSHSAHVPELMRLHTELLLLAIGDAGTAGSTADHRAFLTYTRCREQLEIHFLALRSVEELAARCHVGASHVCRLFARFGGESPHTVLQRLKMNHAATLLIRNSLLVSEAADALGLDPFHFSRVFKRVHGVSPSAFAGAQRSRATS